MHRGGLRGRWDDMTQEDSACGDIRRHRSQDWVRLSEALFPSGQEMGKHGVEQKRGPGW